MQRFSDICSASYTQKPTSWRAKRRMTISLPNTDARCHTYDGSSTFKASGCGWILKDAVSLDQDSEAEWEVFAGQSFILPERVSCTAAEFEALAAFVAFLRAYFRGYESAWHILQTWRPYNFAGSPELHFYERV